MPNLTAELFSRVVEVMTEVFGEGRVEVTPHPEEFPPTVEFENVWISPPDGDCTEYTWGTQHTSYGGHMTPPETDVKNIGSSKSMDDAVKAAILCHAAEMMDGLFLSENDSDMWQHEPETES